MTEAIRHPKRGKAHRPVAARDLYSGRLYNAAACGLPRGTSQAMTETIDFDRTDPADRCVKCWSSK